MSPIVLDYRRASSRSRHLLLIRRLGIAAVLLLAGYASLESHRSYGSGGPVERTKTDLAFVSTAVDCFKINTGRLPADSEGLQALVTRPAGVKGWNGPYLRQLPIDPWGHAFAYSSLGNGSYEIRCSGPDGIAGTADDISFLHPESFDQTLASPTRH